MTRYRSDLFNEICFYYRFWIYIVYTCYMNANGHVHMNRGGKRFSIFRYRLKYRMLGEYRIPFTCLICFSISNSSSYVSTNEILGTSPRSKHINKSQIHIYQNYYYHFYDFSQQNFLILKTNTKTFLFRWNDKYISPSNIHVTVQLQED